jgi:hypothetical protein
MHVPSGKLFFAQLEDGIASFHELVTVDVHCYRHFARKFYGNQENDLGVFLVNEYLIDLFGKVFKVCCLVNHGGPLRVVMVQSRWGWVVGVGYCGPHAGLQAQGRAKACVGNRSCGPYVVAQAGWLVGVSCFLQNG